MIMAQLDRKFGYLKNECMNFADFLYAYIHVIIFG